MSKAPPPNYTQTPNVYFDKWLPAIKSMSELKVVNVIIRNTFGWHEEETSLTLTDIQTLADISRASAVDGVKRALDHGYINSRPNGRSRAYRISVEPIGSESEPTTRLTGPNSGLLNSLGSEPTHSSSGTESEPPVGRGSEPSLISKEKEKKRDRSASSKRECTSRDKRIDHPALKAVLQVKGRYPHKDLWDLVISTLGEAPDVAHMKECWLAWRSWNFRPENFGWLIDWYVNGIPQRNGIRGNSARKDSAGRDRVSPLRDSEQDEGSDCSRCFGSGMEEIDEDGHPVVRRCHHQPHE